MAYIKKLKDNELIGGIDNTDVYPVTSTEAVYNRENVSQEYINNHVDGSKIVDDTVTTGKIANNAVTMGKLDNEVQTLIQQGADSSWTPMGDYDVDALYYANDLVFDPETNSSYLSLRADNMGHAVTDETWWMKVVDGSYVNVMVDELEQAIAQAIGKAQEDISGLISDSQATINAAVSRANLAAQNANAAAANADAKIDWVEEQVDSLTAYEVATELDETSIIPVQNKVVTGAIGVGTEINLSSVLPYYQRVISSGKWIKLTNRYGRFLPVEVGDVYKITASNLGTCVYGVLADNYCDVGIAPDYAEGYSAMASIPANNTREVAINAANAKYLYIETSATGTAGRPPAKIIKTNGVIREDVDANTKDIAKINNELFTQELFNIAYADVTASLPTSYMIVTRVGTQVTTTVTQSGFILRTIYSSPTWNLIVGRKYKLSFDVINNTGKTVSVRWGNSNQEAVSRFLTIANGFEGTKEYEFTYGSGMGQFSFAFTPSATDVTLVVDNISWVNITDLERINENTQEISSLDGRITTLERGDTTEADAIGEYIGDVLPLPKKHFIGSKRMFWGASGSNIRQGADQYNGYLVQFDAFNLASPLARIYSLVNNSHIVNVTPTLLQSRTGTHCNQVCFSNKFYNAEDTFPLIYVSSGSDAIFNYAQVFRMQFIENVFSITQVQEITFPATIGGVTVKWMQIYADNERSALWEVFTVGSLYRFVKFAIPATTEEYVTLTENDILETFDTEGPSSNQQGGVIYNNKLYLAIGSSTDANPPAIDVFDITSKSKIIRRLNLRAAGVFTGELESVFFYNDNLYGIGQGTAGVYRFYFGG